MICCTAIRRAARRVRVRGAMARRPARGGGGARVRTEADASPAPQRPSVLPPVVAASRRAATPRRNGLRRPPAQRAAPAAPRLRAAAVRLRPSAREAGDAPAAAGQSAHQAEPPRPRRTLARRDERRTRRTRRTRRRGRRGSELLLCGMLGGVGSRFGCGRRRGAERTAGALVRAFVGRGAHRPPSWPSPTHSPGPILVGLALRRALIVRLAPERGEAVLVRAPLTAALAALIAALVAALIAALGVPLGVLLVALPLTLLVGGRVLGAA